jgi:hypothetical protein
MRESPAPVIASKLDCLQISVMLVTMRCQVHSNVPTGDWSHRMPDKSNHQLSFQWRDMQVRAIGVPALVVVLVALVVIGHLVGAW